MNEPIKRCAGCGAPIQSKDPKLPGFVPEHVAERERLVCRRCFRLTHYNEVMEVAIDGAAFLDNLHRLTAKPGLVLYLVDLFDLHGSWIGGINRIVGDAPLLLIGNKSDLLPQSVNPSRVIHWLKKEARLNGIKAKDAVLISAEKNRGIAQVVALIQQWRDGGDVFVVGASNVGKSTFINRLILKLCRGIETMLTTSPFPGTTLETIRIPLDDGSEIVDTPGVLKQGRMSEWVEPKELKAITPDKEIRPRVYQLDERQTLFFGGLARFDFLRGVHQSFVCYFANQLPIHRTKLSKADDLYRRHFGEMLSPPSGQQEPPEQERYTFTIKRGHKQDIVISGLGWIVTNGEAAAIEVRVPKGIHVGLRDAII